ncbi:MAG: 5-(carboxyamino)imidazole ribonucleotide synthase, partial [SAR202 cluster bacterium]|nr:5-(carboxyamino)imidazole ribonucleotide synthase [SAR202 cluster bacterium]
MIPNNINELPTGSKIGILGGGQLGRMLVQAAKTLGYKTVILDPTPLSPAGQISDHQIIAEYSSTAAAKAMAHMCDVVTYEFENVDLQSVLAISEIVELHPSPKVLSIARDRNKEKTKLFSLNIPTPKFSAIETLNSLEKVTTELNFPFVLKTATSGYDGKGQVIVESKKNIVHAFELLHKKNSGLIAEEFIDFECELSVICARDKSGNIATFGPSENIHENHILDISIVPARIPEKIKSLAEDIAITIARELKVIGLIAVEMFLTKEGNLLVNELAPRPHNSGHYSIDACDTSQFTQLIRILTGKTLGKTESFSSAVMVNLLGDIWT